VFEKKGSKERGITQRIRAISLEHHIDKLHSQLRATMGFCVKVMDNDPFVTDFHVLQNDAQYLYDDVEKLLDEWQDTTKEDGDGEKVQDI